jgi:hypothetical protein
VGGFPHCHSPPRCTLALLLATTSRCLLNLTLTGALFVLMSRFVRASEYRDSVKKEHSIDNIKVTTSSAWDTNVVSASNVRSVPMLHPSPYHALAEIHQCELECLRRRGVRHRHHSSALPIYQGASDLLQAPRHNPFRAGPHCSRVGQRLVSAQGHDYRIRWRGRARCRGPWRHQGHARCLDGRPQYRIATTRFSNRQVGVWETVSLKNLKTITLDQSVGVVMPFWSDNNIFFPSVSPLPPLACTNAEHAPLTGFSRSQKERRKH